MNRNSPLFVFSGLPLAASGGIITYSQSVISAYADLTDRSDYVVLMPEEHLSAAKHVDPQHVRVIKGQAPLRQPLFKDTWWQNKIGHVAKRDYPNSVFVACTDMYSTARPAHSAIVLHDALDERRPNDAANRLSPRRLLRRFQNHWARQCDVILTVSQFSKDELVRLRGMPQNRVHVAHPWLKREFMSLPTTSDRERVKTRYRLPSRFWFYFGGFRQYKNVARLLQVYAELRKERDCPPLVLGGALPNDPLGTLSVDVPGEMRKLGLTEKEVFCIGGIQAQDLPAVFSLSQIYLFPSMYEGFGYPPLEAGAAGATVIASAAASIPEVMGREIACFTPENKSELKSAWLRALEQPHQFKKPLDPHFTESEGIQRWLKPLLNRFKPTAELAVSA